MPNNFMDNFNSNTRASFILKALLIMLLVSIVLGFILFFLKIKKAYDESVPSVRIAPENLWTQDDPLNLPPIQFSREQKKKWSDEDIEKFFVEPSEEVIQKLHKKNSEKINKLLEGVK